MWRCRVRGVRFIWDIEEIDEEEVEGRATLRLSAQVRVIICCITNTVFFVKVLSEELLSIDTSELTVFVNANELAFIAS